MEKTRSPLGPAPVLAAGAALSGQRALVLDRLQRAGETTVRRLAGELGLHTNTVREHLDGLVGRGLATRSRSLGGGRGRPAWRYSPSDLVDPDPRVRDYAGLATALAGHIDRTSADPAADALAAGRAWGHELAASRTPTAAAGRRATAAAGRHRTVELLAELGFSPQSDARATSVALRRCPLLDAARKHTAVVCTVHLGIVRGAGDVFGADPDRTALVPFAEPGACRLHLLTARVAANEPHDG